MNNPPPFPFGSPFASPKGLKMSNAKSAEKTRKKRRPPKVPWKKPKDMPKRPLSAYNLFFAHEREQLLSAKANAGKVVAGDPKGSHQKTSGIGFANLAKTIAGKWKTIDPTIRARFEAEAATEKARYTKEMLVWRQKKKDEADAMAANDKGGATPGTKETLQGALPKVSPSRSPVKRSMSVMLPVKSKEAPTHPSLERRQSDPGPAFAHQLQELQRLQLEPIPLSPHRFSNPMAALVDDSWLNAFGPAGSFRSLHSAPDYHEDTLRLRQDIGERAYSDSFVTLHGGPSFDTMDDHDIRSYGDIMASVAAEDKHASAHSIFQSSLRSLGANLDDDTVDFLTNLKFDSL